MQIHQPIQLSGVSESVFAEVLPKQALADALREFIENPQIELSILIQHLLIWQAAFSALSMAGFFILIYVIYWINKPKLPLIREELEDEDTGVLNLILHRWIGFQLLWLFPLYQLWSIEWLKILVAPRMYLIEYADSLVKAST